MQTSFKYLTILVLARASGAATAQTIFSAAGGNAAAIQGTVDAFRASLGALNPNVAATFPTGRREINWDGVPDVFAAPNALPANFFNSNSPRGAVFSTPGTGFQVSANTASGTPPRFANLTPDYATDFATFSPQRLFTATGSQFSEMNFFLPGTTTPAATRGFGIVFTDVDLAGSARIQLLSGTTIVGTFNAPVFAGDGGLSFIGVVLPDAVVTEVDIRSGTQALGVGVSESLPNTDLVSMDDFIYGEPQNVPEPGAASLLMLSIAALSRRQRRRSTAIAVAAV